MEVSEESQATLIWGELNVMEGDVAAPDLRMPRLGLVALYRMEVLVTMSTPYTMEDRVQVVEGDDEGLVRSGVEDPTPRIDFLITIFAEEVTVPPTHK